MIHKFINSKTIISKVYDEYNIQSDDFISRLPTWTYNVLRQIRIKQVYVIKNVVGEFDSNRIQIPQYIDRVYKVIINGIPAIPSFSDVITTKTQTGSTIPVIAIDGSVFPNEKNIFDFVTTQDSIVHNQDIEPNLIFTEEALKANNLAKSVFNMNCNVVGSETVTPTYKINNGWIHTNIEYGTCEILCGTIPYEYDSDFDMMFPLIPDDEYLIEAITNYCLMNMLRRGLKHHTLNLQANTRYNNPALAYDYYIPKARNSCNELSQQAKESLSKILNITLL